MSNANKDELLKESGPDVTMGVRQRRLLSETVRIEDELIPAYTKPIAYLVLLMLVLFISWSAITELSEVTSAPGEIVPAGQIKVVQHLSGGTVSDVLVQERQYVKAGDLLVKLDDGRILSDMRQMASRLASLKLRAERQSAFILNREPDFGIFEETEPVMVDVQRQQLANQIKVRDSTLAVLNEQIKQRESRLAQLKESLTSAMKHQELTSDMLAMRQKMAEKRLITRITLIETERAAVTATSEVERVVKEIRYTENELSEAKNKFFETRNQLLQDPLNQLDRLKGEIAETEEELLRVENSAKDLLVRAPADGLVFNLEVLNKGQVIQPGSVLLQIVPANAELDAEVRISPDDIGFVQIGQEVNVKVSSYDFSRFGYASGKLDRISAFSSLDNTGQPYFKGWVKLNENYLGTDTQRYPLLPGMTVTAEILTGYKTLLAYLSDPITKGLANGFRER
ncbi:membrane fusion protein, adhesin transport system [Oceanospirillum multiglobuliferum]|uniref:Membrane fusion protein (MFP) family protein n=1 Tax=Oceanospirillum multiglobuliferum TaxID=64969 RepID=A0A1T4QWZ4_9GAMM|nr:HlyD family type I secretion periplasmic adaptor subunit [Oceanospirillum multiglobuliferum]OPX57084.1 hypothetical protein BTE48_01250 [Oceanospirillum multiglobuliferum]SKA08175.1 membrane fusion protein, adhesin transport system [Oceanospirillum multiglobuliferum]